MSTPKKLPSGNWICLVYIGKDKNGKNKYKSVTAESRKACITKAALITDKPKKDQKITVRQANFTHAQCASRLKETYCSVQRNTYLIKARFRVLFSGIVSASLIELLIEF